jgi:hypothetical protein
MSTTLVPVNDQDTSDPVARIHWALGAMPYGSLVTAPAPRYHVEHPGLASLDLAEVADFLEGLKRVLHSHSVDMAEMQAELDQHRQVIRGFKALADLVKEA